MQGIEYWEQLVKSDTEGTIEKENMIKSYDAGSKNTAGVFIAAMLQAKRCVEIYNNKDLDDSFLKPEMEKLKLELETL